MRDKHAYLNDTDAFFYGLGYPDVGIQQADWTFMKKGWTPPNGELPTGQPGASAFHFLPSFVLRVSVPCASPIIVGQFNFGRFLLDLHYIRLSRTVS
jgi:hypothetical protein